MWMPYGLPGLRVIVAALWLVAVDAIVLVALHYQASELRMAAILGPQIPLAYLVAWFAVTRARHGDVPDWRGMFVRVAPTADVARRPRDRFLSPARAQTWFEWRRHGWSLPALVGIVVPFELLLLFVPGNDTAPVVFGTLFVVLLTPPFMAVLAAAAIGKSDPHARDSYGVTPFMATRPLTSAALIAAKLKMTIWSTLAAWTVVLVSIPVALKLSGTFPVVLERAHAGIEVVGPLRAIAVVLLGFSALLASTWKNLVQSLCIGLTGREWIVKSTVLLGLMSIVAAGMLGDWIVRNRNVQSAIWNAFPWILVALVFCKLCAAGWVAVRLHDTRALSDRTLVTGAGCWLLAVVALYGLLVRLFADRAALLPRGCRDPGSSAGPRLGSAAGARVESTSMTRRTTVLGAVLSCIGLPPLFVLIDAASFYSVNRTNGTMASAGEKREYILYVPRSYDRTRPTPLVISMHGAMNRPSFR
jgi:hypothetical protein